LKGATGTEASPNRPAYGKERAESDRSHTTVRMPSASESFLNSGKRRISNEAGRVKSVFSSFLANSSTLLGRRTKYVLFCRFYFSVSP
jgi:hypothetical protein